MAPPKKGNEALIYCSLLALQFGLQPVLSGIFFAKDVSKISIVIGTEIMKIIISLSTLASEPEKKRSKLFANWSIQNSLKYAALPAILYAIQNLLIQYGYVYLDSMSYNLLSQTKTLSAAFWLWIVIGHRQSSMQIVALLLLLAAAVLLNLSSGTTATSTTAASTTTTTTPSNTMELFGIQGLTEYHLGVILCLSASSLSGLSGALVQTALVGKNAQNPFIYTAELALYGISFLLVTSMFMSSGRDKELILSGRLFSNWTSHTFIPVTSNAMGGLIVGMVTKHAGGVVKGFAMIAGIIVTGIVQWVLYDKPLSLKDFVAVGLVSFSIYLHSSYPVNKSKPVLSQMALLISEDEINESTISSRDVFPQESAQSYNEESAYATALRNNTNNNSKCTASSVDGSTGGCPFISSNSNKNNNIENNPNTIRSARNNNSAQDLGNDYGNFGSHDNLEQLKSQSPSQPQSSQQQSNNSTNNNNNNTINISSRNKSKESLLQRAAASVSPSASFAELHHRTVVTVAQ